MGKRRIGYGLWLLTAALLWFFENNTGTTTVFAASILVPLYSAVCAWQTAKRAQLELHGPDTCRERENAAVDIALRGGVLSGSCRIDIEVSVKNRMTGAANTSNLMYLGRKEHVSIDTTCCGIVDIDIPQGSVSDWFGLCSFALPSSCHAEVIVTPDLYPVQLVRHEITASGDAFTQANWQGNSEAESLGVRDYLPGDDIRRIHWKLSDKLEKTMVRETGRPGQLPLLFLLNQHCEEDTPAETKHACVKAMLSAVKACLAEGESCMVCTGTSAETVQLTAVAEPQEAEDVQRHILSTAFAPDAEEVGRLFERAFPEWPTAGTVLFSAATQTDAAALYRGWPVTLAVPEQAAGAPGSAEIVVCGLSAAEPWLEIWG